MRARGTTFRLAGRLAGDAVEVLMDTCVDLEAGAIIDLSEVSYADDEGVRALGELTGTRRGAAWLETIPRAVAAAGGTTWTLGLKKPVKNLEPAATLWCA